MPSLRDFSGPDFIQFFDIEVPVDKLLFSSTKIYKALIKMAKCDEGYLCAVCSKDVASVTDSDLYLRYVIGLVDPEMLHSTPERHIRCNPCLAQFIVAPDFEPVIVEGEFSKTQLDADYVTERESLVTRGYQRLFEVKKMADTSILEFPLPEVIEALKNRTW